MKIPLAFAVLLAACGSRSLLGSDGNASGGAGFSNAGGQGGSQSGRGGAGRGGEAGNGGPGVGGTGATSGAAGLGGMDGSVDASDAPTPPMVADSAPGCEKAQRGDIFDPSEVYLSGTLAEGTCELDAVAHWSCPNVAAVGFDCNFDGNAVTMSAYVRPTDGRIVYANMFEDVIREFHCDGCPHHNGLRPYPARPLQNDTILPSDCALDKSTVQFLVSPSGLVMYSCMGTDTWRDNGGQHTYVEAGDRLVHLGYTDLALTATRVIDLRTGTGPAITGLPTGSTYAVRAVPPDKFWLARSTGDAAIVEELWEVSREGLATLVGEYGVPTQATPVRPRGRLDKTGSFFQIARGRSPDEEVILRRDISGKSEIVYTESSNPLVRMNVNVSGLITGP